MMEIDIQNILPLVVLAGGSVLVMLVIALKRNHLLVNILSLVVLTVTVLSLNYVSPESSTINPLFIMDGFGVLLMILILFAAFIIIIISYNYLASRTENKEEYYILLLLGVLGGLVLVVSKHFVSFFLGLEILSVSLYVLIAYLRVWENGIEAAAKYLILAGVSSAFLLFGMALVYAEVGSMEFSEIAGNLSTTGIITPIAMAGFGLMIVGVGFKMAIVPFHLWTPDVYEGAPAPVAAFIATISKGGILAVWLRFFIELDGYRYNSLIIIFSIIAILSMLFGNLLALLQTNVKRILAYSSIAHLGYMLVAFIAGKDLGAEAIIFYLLAYFITILGAFSVVTILSDQQRDALHITDYHGLFWRRPWVAAVFTAMLLSLAGIPLTAGFIGKFYILSAGIASSLWVLSVVLVISSVIGLYYYLRIIVEMFKKPDEIVLLHAIKPYFTLGSGVTLTFLTILLVWYGINPSGMIEFIKVVTAATF